MAFTCGFFNSLGHDRLYDAKQFNTIFDGLITDGVYQSYLNEFRVTASEVDNFVTIDTGRAWFNNTWNLNNTIMDKELPISDSSLDRIDAIVLEVDNDRAVRNNSIKVIPGVPSETPQKPTLTRTNLVNQYPLAYVTRKAGINKIEQENVERTVGTEECPYARLLYPFAPPPEPDDSDNTNDSPIFILDESGNYIILNENILGIKSSNDQNKLIFGNDEDSVLEVQNLKINGTLDYDGSISSPSSSNVKTRILFSNKFGYDTTTGMYDITLTDSIANYDYLAITVGSSTDGVDDAVGNVKWMDLSEDILFGKQLGFSFSGLSTDYVGNNAGVFMTESLLLVASGSNLRIQRYRNIKIAVTYGSASLKDSYNGTSYPSTYYWDYTYDDGPFDNCPTIFKVVGYKFLSDSNS